MSKQITILDFCSEKNRGDAAIQLALINLIKDNKRQNIGLSIVTVFGNNEIDKMDSEFDHSPFNGIRYHGSIKPTFYSLKIFGRKNIFISEVMGALGMIYSFYHLILLVLGLSIEKMKYFVSKRDFRTLETIHSADLIIIKGRNYRNRSNKLLEIFRTAGLIYSGILPIIFRKKIVLIGGSFWPLRKGIPSYLMTWFLDHCYLVAVRESFSYNLLQNLLNKENKKKIRLIPDLAFNAFDNDLLNHYKNIKKPSRVQKRKIGLVLVDWK